MKNIVFITFILISFVYADTVGIAQKMWTSVPKDIYNETEPLAAASESSSRAVSGWNQPVQPVIEDNRADINPTKTLDDIKVLTSQANQQQKAEPLTTSEKNWITAVETNVIDDTNIKPTIEEASSSLSNTLPEKSWITVTDENPIQKSEDLPLAKVEPITTQTSQTSIDNTGWIEASQNYNETAFATTEKVEEEKKQEESITKTEDIQQPVMMASTTDRVDTSVKSEDITKIETTSTKEVKETKVSTDTPLSSKSQPQIEEEIIKIPEKEDVAKAEILDNPLDLGKYFKSFTEFVAPLQAFIKENTILSGSFLSVLGLFFYLLFYRPLSSRVNNRLDDEIEVPQARMPQPQKEFYYQEQPPVKSNYVKEQEAMMNASIITQGEYSTLYGLMNETFIFEKERILLSNDITQERKNREIISLEWKFNQILHFSLPKLSTDSPKLFVEGVKELLDEEISRDIMIIALKDILEKDTLSSSQKEDLANYIDKVIPKKAPKDDPIHHQVYRQETTTNYTSYTSQ